MNSWTTGFHFNKNLLCQRTCKTDANNMHEVENLFRNNFSRQFESEGKRDRKMRVVDKTNFLCKFPHAKWRMWNEKEKQRGELYSNYFNDAARWRRGLFSSVVFVLSHARVECAEVCYFNIPTIVAFALATCRSFRIKLRSELRVTAILSWIFSLSLEDIRCCNRLNSSRQDKGDKRKKTKRKRRKKKRIDQYISYFIITYVIRDFWKTNGIIKKSYIIWTYIISRKSASLYDLYSLQLIWRSTIS